ncbi:hypothetical protein HY041_03740, partial [Candidatus Roizmanbacteria bacterium]|nr:hypothetical protein [Candidatus Roizmanbacteria bacterium]
MPDAVNYKERLNAALKLFDTNTVYFDKLDSLKVLLTDLDPRLNKVLEQTFKVLSHLRKLQKGEIIELSADHLPERDEKEKKRKKALLLFLKTWKDLKSEVIRVQKELITPSQSEWLHYGKIIKFAKGPFGIVTLTAFIIVGISLLTANKKNVKVNPTNLPTISSTSKTTIKIIEFNGKKIALTELIISQGPECITGQNQASHYHAKDHTAVKALD